jgi:hypothetical protein
MSEKLREIYQIRRKKFAKRKRKCIDPN